MEAMDTAPEIEANELAARLAMPDPPIVIDVLPEEEYRAAHIPGAMNACVFKVSFLDDVMALAANCERPLVVYGSGREDRASITAAEKLARAGYTQLWDFRGGLAEWMASGRHADGEGAVDAGSVAPADGVHRLDIDGSRIGWAGRNLLTTHSGTIRLRGGEIEICGGRPIGGAFAIAMDSIEVADITDDGLRAMLVRHLESDDFFNVAEFPAAEFRIERIAPLPEAMPGTPNCEVAGLLTMRGVCQEIAFPAIVGPTPDGRFAADAHFDIDRTRWGVLYGSGKFYQKLGMHLVHDDISLELKLVTEASK
jgi:polyisoprenoid-binding protein YceI